MDTQNPIPNQAPRSRRDLLSGIRDHRLAATFALLATLSIGIVAGSVMTRSVSGKEQAVDSSDARPLTVPSAVSVSNEFSKITKQVGPAVVNINTTTLPKPSTPASRQQRRGQQAPNGGDDDQQTPGDMQDFFNRFFGGQGGDDDSGPPNAEREALGSGFIVDSRGYIVTNNHVIDKADKIYVKLASDPDNPADHGRLAKVVGTDPETDIAVIKIDAPQPLPTVKLGNSEGAQVGDWVLAIGSPFSLSETVTAGIVSAKNRSIDDPGRSGTSNQFQKFIQTDAAINPGNSGGPLVDMAGQVIGMNTAIYTQSMGSQGVGFAMPSNVIANVYNMLISPEHKVVRGSIGITFQNTEAAAVGRVYGFASGGVLVNAVTPNGPAAKAGVKPGDVIISINGTPVKNGDELVTDISSRKVGSTAQLGIRRDGKPMTLDVGIMDRATLFADLGKQPNDNTPPAQVDAGEGKLGITVAPVPSSIASRLGLKGGVMVTDVRPGSFADEINLTKGAIITEIDTPNSRRPVTDQSAYQSIVSSLKSGDDVAFIVRSGMANSPASPSYLGGTLP